METPKAKRTMAERMWGRMGTIELPARVVSLVFVATAIVAMSFCQLGFWPIGIIDEKPVYLMLMLGPLVMGALMFGPLTGALLGLFAGAVLLSHAMLFPLDFYEVYFMTPLNTFVLITVVGALSGWLFGLVLRREPTGAARACRILAISLVVSFLTSGLFQLNTVVFYGGLDSLEFVSRYLLNSPLGTVVQALIDAAGIAILCLAADAIVRKAAQRGGDRSLLSLFRNWMLLVSSIVFMLTCAIVFTVATVQVQMSAEEIMISEVEYFQKQMALHQDDSAVDFVSMLQGYEADLDGIIVITDEKGTIIGSDDTEKFVVGASLLELIGYEDALAESNPVAYAFEGLEEKDPWSIAIQDTDENGVTTMDLLFLVIGSFGDGYVFMMKTVSMVYAGRFIMMAALTLLAIALIAATAVLAAVLLRRVVVRRIDETNTSLEKITGGDLNERVGVRDSREFSSLSAGINTTVSALKDTIAEVEHRNAQDLATAKAIQESALPRDFPPFPDIDRFDIYASMKTAKEVGGDFYDFFLIEDGAEGASKLGFVMADVSGKGIPAALFMMTAKTQIRNYMEAGLPVSEAVDAANHQLCIGNDAGMFVTAWVGVLDYDAGMLSYVNAGHNPPLLLHDGAWEWVKDVSGMPLGLFDGIPYDRFERRLAVGDMLYAYTDGVTEAMDAGGNLFGEERLEETLYRYADFNPRSVGVGVRRALTDYTLDAEQSDDITMLILKYGVPPEKRAVMVLPADDKQLVHVYNFIHEELKRRNAPKSAYNPLDIAAEELFVNVCHYAYPDATPDNPGEVRIGFEYEASPPSLTVTISDDGIPYNPLAKPDAVTPDDIMDVPIGGLGILMAKRSVDEMTYERAGESNVLTFRKGW